MKRLWHNHSLLILIILIGVGWLAAGVWASWFEFRTNETAGLDNHAPFVSMRFFSFVLMQIAMNYVPELMGVSLIILLHGRFRDRFEEESP